MAAQTHGFVFESVVLGLPGFTPARPGAIFDGALNGVPVSIKTHAAGTDLCLGDYARQAAITEAFILVVGTYAQEATTGAKRDWHVETFMIAAADWTARLHYSAAGAMRAGLALISNLSADDARWKAFMLEHTSAFAREHAEDAPMVALAGKRDHTTQKRIQCRINARNLRAMRGAFGPGLSVEQVAAISAAANNAATATLPVDRFYSRREGVAKGIAVLQAALAVAPDGPRSIADFSVLVEPAAGAGAFLAPLRAQAGKDAVVLAYDVAPPEGADAAVERLDFLADGRVAVAVNGRTALAVGNPPYGRNCSLAVRFINRCASTPGVAYIAFILPLSFEKPSVQRRVKGCTLVSSARLSEAEHTFDDHERCVSGTPRKVPSCFQVWRCGVHADPAGPVTGPAAPNDAPACWRFVKWGPTPPQNVAFDLQVVRAGGSAGRAFLPADRKGAVANYFICLDEPGLSAQVVAALNTRRGELAADFTATTAARSLAKPPLVRLLNAIVAAEVRLEPEVRPAAEVRLEPELIVFSAEQEAELAAVLADMATSLAVAPTD